MDTSDEKPAQLNLSDNGGAHSPSSDEFADLEKQLDQLWPQVAEPFAGRRIAHYDLKRILGSGAFGVVYLAEDTHLGREVALKLPRPEVLFDREKRKRFESEAASAARLSHDGIVAIYHAELDSLTPYIASEYCDGPDLAAWLEQHGPVEKWQEAVEFIVKVAESLDYAHGQGVYHRDLKPANLLLAPKSETSTETKQLGTYDPRIADFGLSKLVDANLTDTRSSLLVGTPLYMAPEQIDKSIRSDSHAATDVYSLGVILFELLTGKPPIDGESYVEVLDSIRSENAMSLKAARSDVPSSLESICKRCFEKNPEARYQSADSLAKDLRRCLQNEPILGRPHGIVARLGYWARRPSRIAEAGWFTVWVQTLWSIWVVGTLFFIRFSNVDLNKQDWNDILFDFVFVYLTVHAPIGYLGWKTKQGARWAPWWVVGITLALLPGLIVSVITEPFFFAPFYKGSTSWFVWAVYFMLITCFVMQLSYNICAILAMRSSKARSGDV